MTDLETWIIWPDTHVPFEDKRAVDLVLKIATKIHPEGQIVLGDFADFMSVSTHPKTPIQARYSLDEEIFHVCARLDQLDSLGCSRKIYLCGNHETRGQRLAMKEALGLYDTLDPARLFRLKERGWKFYPYQVPVKVGKIWFVHDIGYAGPRANIQNGEAFQASVVTGHNHYAALHYFGSADGKRHVSATAGWLGSKRAAEYLSPIKITRNWQTAFGLMRVETKTKNSHFQLIPIVDYKAVVDGALFRG